MSRSPFEDNLKKITEDFSMSPNPDGWEKIESALPKNKKKKRPIFFLPFIGMAAMLFSFIFFVSPFSHKSETSDGQTITSNQTSGPVIENAKAPQSTSIDSSLNSNAKSFSKTSHPKDIISKQSAFVNNDLPNKSGKSSIQHTASENHPKAINNNKRPDKTGLSSNVLENESSLQTPMNNDEDIKQDLSPSLNPDDTIIAKLQSEPTDSTLIAHATNNENKLQSRDSGVTNLIGSVSLHKRLLGSIEIEGIVHNTASLIRLDKEYSGTNPYQNDYNNRKKEDKARLNTYFGINYLYYYKRHTLKAGLRYLSISHSMSVVNYNNSILSGVSSRYSSFNYNKSDTFLTESFDAYNNTNNLSLGNPPAEEAIGTIVNTYRFISLPLTYGYVFHPFRKVYFNIVPEISFAYNMLLSHSGLVHTKNSGLYVKSENYPDNNITRHHFSYGVGSSFKYYKNGIYLGVNFRYMQSITPLEKSVVSTFYNSFGAGISIGFCILEKPIRILRNP